MDKLITDGHLTADEKTDVLSGKSRDREINLLLEKLIKRGGSSFTSFIEALKMTGNERIADKILQTDSSEDTALQQEETFFSDNTSDFREDEILHLYKDKQMYKVKLSDMTTNYKQLQAELAITEHKVESMSKEIQKLESDLEETRQELVCDDSNEAEGEIFRRMNTGANSKEMMRRVRDLQLALDEKDEMINSLHKDLEYYRDQLDITEKQEKKQREENGEKDARIMILRNQVGKLQNYLQASKQNVNRLNTEQKRVVEQLGKQQLEKFTEIENKVESGKKDQSKRFNTLEDKIDTLIKMMSSNGQIPAVKNTEKSKMKGPNGKESYHKKGKSNRYKI